MTVRCQAVVAILDIGAPAVEPVVRGAEVFDLVGLKLAGGAVVIDVDEVLRV